MNQLLALVERHRAVVLPVSGSLLLMAVAVIGWQLAGSLSDPISPPRVPQAYFYDLHTGDLFTAWRAEVGEFLEKANLKLPDSDPGHGDRRQPTEHLAALLEDMQQVARFDAEAQW